MKILATLVLAFAVCAQTGAADVPTPAAGHRVVDESHVLTSAEVQQLADKLKALEVETGAQVAVLTVPTAGDEGIAPFANRVFVAWGLGKKGVDNGVLIVLATTDRKVRIEVGRGLEGDIPDITAKRITADTMAPFLKNGKYAEGLIAGVDSLATRIDKTQPRPKPRATPRATEYEDSLWGYLLRGPMVVLYVIFAMLTGVLVYFRIHPEKVPRETPPGTGNPNGWRDSSMSSSGFTSSDSSSSSSNDSSGGGGDSAGGGSDSSY